MIKGPISGTSEGPGPVSPLRCVNALDANVFLADFAFLAAMVIKCQAS